MSWKHLGEYRKDLFNQRPLQTNEATERRALLSLWGLKLRSSKEFHVFENRHLVNLTSASTNNVFPLQILCSDCMFLNSSALGRLFAAKFSQKLLSLQRGSPLLWRFRLFFRAQKCNHFARFRADLWHRKSCLRAIPRSMFLLLSKTTALSQLQCQREQKCMRDFLLLSLPRAIWSKVQGFRSEWTVWTLHDFVHLTKINTSGTRCISGTKDIGL